MYIGNFFFSKICVDLIYNAIQDIFMPGNSYTMRSVHPSAFCDIISSQWPGSRFLYSVQSQEREYLATQPGFWSSPIR